MAASPKWKVYNAMNEYQASCKDLGAAACLVSFFGDGATVRLYHREVVWTEGSDGHADENYDDSCEVMLGRAVR
jgi:hypothetical protein